MNTILTIHQRIRAVHPVSPLQSVNLPQTLMFTIESSNACVNTFFIPEQFRVRLIRQFPKYLRR
jgi:hypothetical protein